MDISIMDKSHFNLGINSKQMMDANFNFNEITNQKSDASTSYDYNTNRPQFPEDPSGYHKYAKSDSSDNDWVVKNEKCKQEDRTGFMGDIPENENSNYDSDNEPYQYAYDPISNLYANNKNSTIQGLSHSSGIGGGSSSSITAKQNSIGGHHNHTGLYQISSTKNQLPSWYDPPSYSQLQYPQFPYHQGNYVGSDTMPVEHSMRNMIHLSSRY